MELVVPFDRGAEGVFENLGEDVFEVDRDVAWWPPGSIYALDLCEKILTGRLRQGVRQ